MHKKKITGWLCYSEKYIFFCSEYFQRVNCLLEHYAACNVTYNKESQLNYTKTQLRTFPFQSKFVLDILVFNPIFFTSYNKFIFLLSVTIFQDYFFHIDLEKLKNN